MRLGSTPKHTFTLPFETDLIQELKITYSQNKKIILENISPIVRLTKIQYLIN